MPAREVSAPIRPVQWRENEGHLPVRHKFRSVGNYSYGGLFMGMVFRAYPESRPTTLSCWAQASPLRPEHDKHDKSRQDGASTPVSPSSGDGFGTKSRTTPISTNTALVVSPISPQLLYQVMRTSHTTRSRQARVLYASSRACTL